MSKSEARKLYLSKAVQGEAATKPRGVLASAAAGGEGDESDLSSTGGVHGSGSGGSVSNSPMKGPKILGGVLIGSRGNSNLSKNASAEEASRRSAPRMSHIQRLMNMKSDRAIGLSPTVIERKQLSSASLSGGAKPLEPSRNSSKSPVGTHAQPLPPLIK